MWAAIRGRIDGQCGDRRRNVKLISLKKNQRQADFIISSFLGCVFAVIFSYGSDGIHNHEETPFGRIFLELFPSIEEGIPRFLSLHFSSFGQVDLDLTLYGEYDTVDGVDGQKLCTTKDDDYPSMYKVLTIPAGCLGFLPSTVSYSRSLWESGIINSNQPIPRDGGTRCGPGRKAARLLPAIQVESDDMSTWVVGFLGDVYIWELVHRPRIIRFPPFWGSNDRI